MGQQLSIQPASESARAVLPSVLASKTGVSRELAGMVVAAVSERRTIRADVADGGERALMALTAEFEFCAKSYCHCQRTDEMVFDECVEFVLERFGFLNVGELRQAFRLAAAGELEGVSLEAYYGSFTVGMLGKLLWAYNERRNPVVAEVVSAEKSADYAEALVTRSERHGLDKWSEERLEKLRQNDGLCVEHCTVFDFEHFTKMGELVLPDEEKRRQLWADAYLLARGEVMSGVMRGEWAMKELLKRLDAGRSDDGFYVKRLNYYKRLLVLHWVRETQSIHE